MERVTNLPRRRAGRVLLAALLVAVPLVGAGPAEATESLSYHWSLRGFMGRLAGIVVPHEGHGELRSRPGRSDEGGRVTELEITSPASADGEFFLYGGELRPDGSTSSAWSSYR